MDGYTKHPETFSSAKNKKIKIAFSAISFEFWILLHFEYTSRAFEKSEKIINYLKKNKHMEYNKAATDVYQITKQFINQAIENAKKLQKYQIKCNSTNTPIYKLNPYTNINELVEKIWELQV